MDPRLCDHPGHLRRYRLHRVGAAQFTLHHCGGCDLITVEGSDTWLVWQHPDIGPAMLHLCSVVFMEHPERLIVRKDRK